MAVAVDASTPVRVTVNATGATTASFNPPASVLIATVICDPTVTATISNNGGALTWTEIRRRDVGDGGDDILAYAAFAVLPSGRTGMTVSDSIGGAAQDHSLKVYVLTGADTVDPVGASAEGSSTNNTLTTTAFTTEAAASLGFVVGVDGEVPGTPSSSDVTLDAVHVHLQLTGGAGYKTLGGAGTSATFSVDAAGTAASSWNWISFEIKAAAEGTNRPIPMLSQYGNRF